MKNISYQSCTFCRFIYTTLKQQRILHQITSNISIWKCIIQIVWFSDKELMKCVASTFIDPHNSCTRHPSKRVLTLLFFQYREACRNSYPRQSRTRYRRIRARLGRKMQAHPFNSVIPRMQVCHFYLFTSLNQQGFSVFEYIQYSIPQELVYQICQKD